jgi:acetolactate synthase-1/2/3 large subunit
MASTEPIAISDIRPSEGRELSGAQIIWESLVRLGTEVVFGYPGGAIMPTYDILPHYPLHHVLVRHEQGAAHMADGYARASGKVGVAVATSGPGATNLVTGIATAMLDSIPMVCITGQVASGLIGTDAFQEVDITGVTLPITKHNYMVTSSSEIAPTLREAFFLAATGRPGPVVVDVSKDAQLGSCPFVWSDEPIQLPGYSLTSDIDEKALAAAAELIDRAERPIVLAGHGIIKANATPLLAQLVARIDAPVAFTLLGLGGLSAEHPRSLGMLGMHGEASVNQAVQQADLVICLGARFDDRVTGDTSRFAPRARVVHVDIDPAEIDKNIKTDVAVVGDLAEVLPLLIDRVKPRVRSAWNDHVDGLQTPAPRVEAGPTRRPLRAPQVIEEIWRQTNGKALVVADVGQHQMWTAQCYALHSHGRLLTTGGLGTMGYALPAAIGARLARPHDEVWVIVGDGGFQMTACELNTCAQEQIDLKIAIVNNGYLGMVRQWQELFFERRYVETRIGQPDFVKLAEAHGLVGVRVDQPSNLEDAVRNVRATAGTVVMDFRVEHEDCVYPMVPAGHAIDEMLRRPTPATEDHSS